jgi:hypothetical protein
LTAKGSGINPLAEPKECKYCITTTCSAGEALARASRMPSIKWILPARKPIQKDRVIACHVAGVYIQRI